MPIYEYRCKDCGARFSVLRRMSEADAPIACAQCASHATSRALSLFAASSRSATGETRTLSGGGGCGSCASHNCGSCGHN